MYNDYKLILDNILKNEYDIVSIAIDKDSQSTNGNVYIVSCENKKFVIKIYDDLQHTNSMIKLHNYLNEKNFNIPKIIKTINNESYCIFEKKFIVVYSFLYGKHVNELWNNDDNNEIIKLIAKEVRKFHNQTEFYNDINLKIMPFESKTNRKSVLHFDLTKDNIFINNNNIEFIDFDDAKYGDSICDIAILISLFFISKSRGINLTGIHLFIDEYYGDDIKLREEETKYIKEYASKWIEYVLNGNEFDTSTTESFKVKLELIKKLDDIL